MSKRLSLLLALALTLSLTACGTSSGEVKTPSEAASVIDDQGEKPTQPAETSQPPQETSKPDINVVGIDGTLNTQKFNLSISKIEVVEAITADMGIDVETTAGEGKVLLHVTFVAKNITDETENIMHMGFNAYIDGQKVVPLASIAGKVDEIMPLFGAVSAGKEMEGYVVWEVPEDWQEFQTSYIEASTGFDSEQHFVIYRDDV